MTWWIYLIAGVVIVGIARSLLPKPRDFAAPTNALLAEDLLGTADLSPGTPLSNAFSDAIFNLWREAGVSSMSKSRAIERFNESPRFVQLNLLAMVLNDMGQQPRLRGEQWMPVRNPFMPGLDNRAHLDAVARRLKARHGVVLSIPDERLRLTESGLRDEAASIAADAGRSSSIAEADSGQPEWRASRTRPRDVPSLRNAGSNAAVRTSEVSPTDVRRSRETARSTPALRRKTGAFRFARDQMNAFEALCLWASTEGWCWKIWCGTCGHAYFKQGFQELAAGRSPLDGDWPIYSGRTSSGSWYPRSYDERERELLLEICRTADIGFIARHCRFPDWLGYLGLVLHDVCPGSDAYPRLSSEWARQLITLLPHDGPTMKKLRQVEEGRDLLNIGHLANCESELIGVLHSPGTSPDSGFSQNQ